MRWLRPCLIRFYFTKCLTLVTLYISALSFIARIQFSTYTLVSNSPNLPWKGDNSRHTYEVAIPYRQTNNANTFVTVRIQLLVFFYHLLNLCACKTIIPIPHRWSRYHYAHPLIEPLYYTQRFVHFPYLHLLLWHLQLLLSLPIPWRELLNLSNKVSLNQPFRNTLHSFTSTDSDTSRQLLFYHTVVVYHCSGSLPLVRSTWPQVTFEASQLLPATHPFPRLNLLYLFRLGRTVANFVRAAYCIVTVACCLHFHDKHCS